MLNETFSVIFKHRAVGKIRIFSNFLWIFLESWIFWCFGFFGLFGFLRFRGFYSFSWILRFFGITEVFRLNSWIFNFWIQKIYFWSIWERVGFLRFVDFHFLDWIRGFEVIWIRFSRDHTLKWDLNSIFQTLWPTTCFWGHRSWISNIILQQLSKIRYHYSKELFSSWMEHMFDSKSHLILQGDLK